MTPEKVKFISNFQTLFIEPIVEDLSKPRKSKLWQADSTALELEKIICSLKIEPLDCNGSFSLQYVCKGVLFHADFTAKSKPNEMHFHLWALRQFFTNGLELPCSHKIDKLLAGFDSLLSLCFPHTYGEFINKW